MILDDIDRKLDFSQFGGLQGKGVDQYLSDPFQTVADLRSKGMAGILLSLDFQSAFNAMNHEYIVSSLAELGVRDCAIRAITGYLTNRMTLVKWGEV